MQLQLFGAQSGLLVVIGAEGHVIGAEGQSITLQEQSTVSSGTEYAHTRCIHGVKKQL